MVVDCNIETQGDRYIVTVTELVSTIRNEKLYSAFSAAPVIIVQVPDHEKQERIVYDGYNYNEATRVAESFK